MIRFNADLYVICSKLWHRFEHRILKTPKLHSWIWCYCKLQNKHSVNLYTDKKRCTDINFSKMSINGLNFHRYIFWLPKGTQNGWVDGWMDKRELAPPAFQHIFDFWQTIKSRKKKFVLGQNIGIVGPFYISTVQNQCYRAVMCLTYKIITQII